MRTRIFAAIAIVFFFTPLALRAVGITARPFENRRLAEAPRLSQGWEFFDQATRFFIDRMPLREQAVRANTWISLNVFDTPPAYGAGHQDVAGAPGFAGRPEPPTPTPEPAQPAPEAPQPAAPAPAPPTDSAVVGRNGWLYLQGELWRPCQVFIETSEAMRRWRRLAQVVRDSGRKAVVAIAPDKTSIVPQHLPATYPGQECQGERRREQWAVMERPDPRIATAREALTGRGNEAFKRKDSHWTTLGAAELVRAALEKLGRRVRLSDGDLRRREATYTGDLTNLLGQPEEDTSTEVSIVRPPGAPKLRGRTLLVMDSYGVAFEQVLRPYAEDLATILWVGTPDDQLIAAIRDADNVVFQTVEREIRFRASDEGLLDAAFLDALEAAL